MFKQRARTRGSALVNILMMSVVLTMLVSVIVTSAAFLWNSSTFYRNKDDAKLMAQSAVNQAIYQLMEDDKWGESGTERILLKGDSWPGIAELHFRSGEEHASVWNMAPDSSVVRGSLDNFVPEHSVQLVARAEVRGAKVTYEAVVRKKGLDYAIASSGPFRAAGRNEAAALDNLDDLRGLDLSGGVPQDELVKDDQARTTIATAFAPPGGNGMEFEGELVLHGDAISASGIDGLDNVTFENGGEATMGAVDVDIVDIDIRKYDPLGPDFTLDNDLVNRLSSTSYDNANLEGFFRWQGGGTLTGQTELKTGLLYVDGDLVINGNLTGTGAIICTGDIIITGHADLSATSQVAILAEGDLKFRGTTKGQSLFTGFFTPRAPSTSPTSHW